LQRPPLFEILVVRYQHVLDVVRVIEKENVLSPHPEKDYVAVLAREVLQISERVAAEDEESAAEQFRARAGRIAGDSHVKLLKLDKSCRVDFLFIAILPPLRADGQTISRIIINIKSVLLPTCPVTRRCDSDVSITILRPVAESAGRRREEKVCP
jgi:hypothetical protein